MKKILFVTAIGMLSASAFAQNGFYLSPAVGAGISNVKQDFFSIDPSGAKIKKAPVFSYSAGINAGYQLGRIRIEAGLQYGISGYSNPDLSLFNLSTQTIIPGSMSTTYRHLSVPVKVGYEIPLGNKLKFIPALGVLTSYNLGASLESNFADRGKSKMDWDADAFETQNRRISIWGTASLRIEYKLSERLSLFAGPSAQYMVSDLLKAPKVYLYNASQRNYNMHLDLGLVVRL